MDKYRLSKKEIDKLRQEVRAATTSPEYKALLKQIKPLDFSKFRENDSRKECIKDKADNG